MMKFITAGVWGVLVTGATVFGANHFALFDRLAAPGEAREAKIETRPIKVIRVPIMAAGKVSGYVLLGLSVAFDSGKGKELADRLDDVVTDEAFRAVYETSAIDFAKSSKTDLTDLLMQIGSKADGRLGGGVISSVMVREFTYVTGNNLRQ